MKFFIFFILISCKPQEKTTQDNSKSPIYYRWNTNSLMESPLEISLAEEFLPLVSHDESNPTGINSVERMGIKWNDAHPVLDFFTIPFNLSSNRIYTNLEDYLDDDEMGIYYSSGWYRELSPSALAITQFAVIRRNTGTIQEYRELIHGDILVNFRYFDYFTDVKSNKFDLLTIILHELGHLIGFQHTNNPKIMSVMSPYLDKGEKRRNLTNFDVEILLKHYPPSSLKTPPISSLLNIEDEGKIEKHIIELESDGTCKHYLNGHYNFSHQ